MLSTAGVGRTKRFRGWEAECAVASVMRREAAVISIRWAAELGKAATKSHGPAPFDQLPSASNLTFESL